MSEVLDIYIVQLDLQRADRSDLAGHLAEVVNSAVKQQPPDQSRTAADLEALEGWTQEMNPLKLRCMSVVFQQAVGL